MDWFLYDRDLRQERVKKAPAQKKVCKIYAETVQVSAWL